MFSNHTNEGMLTDSYTTILVEVDIERNLEAIKHHTELLDSSKHIALNYKILDCHSSGLTLRGGLISFIYEVFNADGTKEQRLYLSDKLSSRHLTFDPSSMLSSRHLTFDPSSMYSTSLRVAREVIRESVLDCQGAK